MNVGDAIVALRSSAVCCAVDTGFAVSAVLSTLPSPTIVLVIPTVVPPTYRLPPIPAPPATWSAPVAVLDESVVLVIEVAGAVTVPVKVGDASGALKSSAVCWEVDTGLLASLVLSKLPSPTIVLVIPDTVPVNVGEAKLAFRSNAVCCAVETGLLTSLVLSTFERPTIVWVIPTVVPPTYKLPPMPMPPDTWSAPVVVLVETVAL